MNEIRRVDYQVGPLLEQDLLLTPLGQFQCWLQEAATAGIEEPNRGLNTYFGLLGLTWIPERE